MSQIKEQNNDQSEGIQNSLKKDPNNNTQEIDRNKYISFSFNKFKTKVPKPSIKRIRKRSIKSKFIVSDKFPRDRSRSRKKSKKHRSRSRSKTRHSKSKKSKSYHKKRSEKKSKSRYKQKRSRTRSRTRSPVRPKGKFRFDSPPKDQNPLLEKPNHLLPITGGLIQQGAGTTDLLQQMQMIKALQAVQQSKNDRKLYIGNLPPDMTPQSLQDVLNSALQKMNINTNPPGQSIISSWISPDGHYGFVDFRTPEEANNGFALNNVAILGQPLKVGRPKNYQVQSQFVASGGSISSLLNPGQNPLSQSLGLPTTGLEQIVKVYPQSKILVLKNMVEISELQIDEEYNDILEDVKDECNKFGQVLDVKIPRPVEGMHVPGLGKIFVMFNTSDQAKEARKNLQGRTFSEKTVECSYYDERRFQDNDFNE